DLVGAARLEFELDERVAVEALEHAVDGDGVLAQLVVADDLFLALAALARGAGSDRHVDHVDERLDLAVDDGEVALLDLASFELASELPVGLVALREDDDAAGVPIEPVDDAGAGELLADRAEFTRGAVAKVPRERVDHGAGEVAARRMHDDVGRFVDDEQV